MAAALLEAGQAASARRSCADGLARAREAGDLWDQAEFLFFMAELDLEAGHMPEAETCLREALRLAVQVGDKLRLTDCLDVCGLICAATGRRAEAITLWAAYAAQNTDAGTPELPQEAHRRQEPFRKAAQALGPAQVRSAEERGAAMTLDTAAEFVTMVTDQDPQAGLAPPATGQLSPREQELVILVARGHTDAQIAGQLYISVRTVRSHLDRIRDKTGCRRRADLTRLALQAGLV
jgi:DNA-binding CsgD family transcriptional regulator